MLKCPPVFSVFICKGSREFKVKIQERELENCKRDTGGGCVLHSFLEEYQEVENSGSTLSASFDPCKVFLIIPRPVQASDWLLWCLWLEG